MKRTVKGSKIEEMTAGELKRLTVGSVYQVEFVREYERTPVPGQIREGWSLFLVEYEETK